MIKKDSDFDDLIADYIARFTNLAGNSNVLVESFYQKLDKNISKRFAFENKLLRKIDKYRFKAVKKEIRSEYGWWARLTRWLRGKPKGARNAAKSPPTDKNNDTKENTQQLVNKISTVTQNLNVLENTPVQALPSTPDSSTPQHNQP